MRILTQSPVIIDTKKGGKMVSRRDFYIPADGDPSWLDKLQGAVTKGKDLYSKGKGIVDQGKDVLGKGKDMSSASPGAPKSGAPAPAPTSNTLDDGSIPKLPGMSTGLKVGMAVAGVAIIGAVIYFSTRKK